MENSTSIGNEGGSWFIRGYSFLTIESIRIITKGWYLCGCVMKGGIQRFLDYVIDRRDILLY